MLTLFNDIPPYDMHSVVECDTPDAHNLMQVGKCCRYMDNLFDIARRAVTYREGFFWMYLRKGDLQNMLRIVKMMQAEYKDELK